MKRSLLVLFICCSITQSYLFGQGEGWTRSCLSHLPSVSEVMVDAFGTDEFYSEYLIIRVGEQPFSIENLSFKVINPSNNAFIGSVKIDKYSTHYAALATLNNKIGTICPMGTVFRDAFSEPYYGVIPPHSAILIFNNKDSVDLSYLTDGIFKTLCGSKVFAVFGTIKTQSPGVSIFRNHPRNGSCGTTGCLRQIQFQYEGSNSPFCEQVTYDIKNLPHLNTSNPPDGYGDGSFIRPLPNGKVQYGGGNLTGNGIPMPPLSMMCLIPPTPQYGKGFWNVSVFEGYNNFTAFRGFYQAKGNHTPSVKSISANDFEYNTERDGWRPSSMPSEAHTTYGALSTYIGCNVMSDSFSLLAQRQGFPCANYQLKLLKSDDFLKVRIDSDGNGTWDFEQTYLKCLDCNTLIWQGSLNSQSKIEIQSSDKTQDFSTHILFEKDTLAPNPIKIQPIVTPTSCKAAEGQIQLRLAGGTPPYSIKWQGKTSVSDNSLIATGLLPDLYKVIVNDTLKCSDSLDILIPTVYNIEANAGKDTAYCAGGTAILRGVSNKSMSLFEWKDIKGNLISNQPTISVSPSISTFYILKVSDTTQCFDTDTVLVKVNDLPYLKLNITPQGSICNDAVPILKVQGAKSYKWSSLPSIATSALNKTEGDSVVLYALTLPALEFQIIVAGTDSNGCKSQVDKTLTISPLPIVTIAPIKDTLCDNGLPYSLSGTPSGGQYSAVKLPLAQPCVGCVKGNLFYPSVSGEGRFTIKHEFISEKGCSNAPSIEVSVKKCTVCRLSDTTEFYSTSCNPQDAGVFKTYLKNQKGCDSIIISTVKFTPSDTTIIQYSTCNPNQVGISKKIFKNRFNCDSIVLEKTVLIPKIDTVRIELTSCNAFRIGQQIIRDTNQSGCDSITIITTKFSNSPVKFTLISPQGIQCHDVSSGILEVKNIIGGVSPYNILWNTGDTSTRINNLKLGTYKVTITDSEGCYRTDSFYLSPHSPLSIDAMGIAPKCLEDKWGSIQINQFKGGNAPFSFYLNQQKQVFNTVPFSIYNLKTGSYNVLLKDKNGCSTDTTIRIEEGRELILDLGENMSINLGDSAILKAVSNYPLTSIKWVSYDSLKCLSCLPLVVRPFKTQHYQLLAKDSLGCQAQDNTTVFVNKQQRVFVPTSFSPNDDGINDILMIHGNKDVKQVKTLQIYNRWGVQVFEASNFPTDDIRFGWDGRFKGESIPSTDSLIYYAIVEFIDGKTEIFTGDITLLR